MGTVFSDYDLWKLDNGENIAAQERWERAAEEEAEQRALLWDAMRWRFTQRPGYGVNYRYEFSEVESNVVVVYAGVRDPVGVGRDLKSAIDCALYIEGEHEDLPPHSALTFWRQHFRERRRAEGKGWEKPPAPEFYLDDEGRVRLREAP